LDEKAQKEKEKSSLRVVLIKTPPRQDGVDAGYAKELSE